MHLFYSCTGTEHTLISSNKDMAEVFNEYFATVFTKEVGGCMPEVLTARDGIELSNICLLYTSPSPRD